MTFDDLPGTALTPGQHCNARQLYEVSEKLLEPFRREQWPVAGFVTESRLCEELGREDLASVLEFWLESGAELGNHTFSHLDLNSTGVEEYIEDIKLGERTLRPILEAAGVPLRYFRYPYLHSGDSELASAKVSAWLESNGYAIGVVTMDNQEWVYSAVYARAKARGDRDVMEEVTAGYLRHLSESIGYYERLSLRRFGRNIPHVLLLHANALNADVIDDVVNLFLERGYTFDSLTTVMEDEAYSREDLYIGPRGLSWIHRWFPEGPEESTAEPRESLRIQELMRTYGRAQR